MKNDPRIIKAKFASTCATCGKSIEKGTNIIYWPAMPKGKQTDHQECGWDEYRRSLASFEDENNY